MKRTVIGAAVIGALAIGAVVAAVTYEPPQPGGCAVLIQQAEHTSDVAADLEAAGCEQAPAGHDPTALP